MKKGTAKPKRSRQRLRGHISGNIDLLRGDPDNPRRCPFCGSISCPVPRTSGTVDMTFVWLDPADPDSRRKHDETIARIARLLARITVSRAMEEREQQLRDRPKLDDDTFFARYWAS
jgi:hypothetical protein